jgi:hypothetical protein
MALASVLVNWLIIVMQSTFFLTPKTAMCVFLRTLYNSITASHPWIKYLENASRYYDVDDELEDIDDIKNGLLLYLSIHHLFGEGSVAFLKVSQPSIVLFCSV